MHVTHRPATASLATPNLATPNLATRWLVVSVSGAALLVAGIAFALDPRMGVAALALPVMVLVAASPRTGLALLLLTLPLEALSALTPDGVVTLTKLLGVAVVGAWLLHALVLRRPIHVPSTGVTLVAFLVWAASSALWAVDPGASNHLIVTLLQLLALYLLVADLLDTPAALRGALGAHVAGGALLAVLGLVLMGEGVLQQGRAAIVVDRQMLVESNDLAAALLLPLAICLAWGLDRSRPVRERVALTVAGALCLTTLLFTLSRGGLVALVAMTIAVAVAQRSLWLPVLGCLLALPALAAVGPELWERLSEGVTLADRAAGRLDIWQVGWVVIRSHPLAGVGLGCFPVVYFDHLSDAAGVSWKHALGVALVMEKSPHNTYLGAAAELGCIGLGLLVLALAVHLVAVVRLFRGLRARDHPAASLVLAGASGLLGLVVFACSADILNRKYLWLALGLAALGRGRVRAARQTAAVPPPRQAQSCA